MTFFVIAQKREKMLTIRGPTSATTAAGTFSSRTSRCRSLRLPIVGKPFISLCLHSRWPDNVVLAEIERSRGWIRFVGRCALRSRARRGSERLDRERNTDLVWIVVRIFFFFYSISPAGLRDARNWEYRSGGSTAIVPADRRFRVCRSQSH